MPKGSGKRLGLGEQPQTLLYSFVYHLTAAESTRVEKICGIDDGCGLASGLLAAASGPLENTVSLNSFVCAAGAAFIVAAHSLSEYA